MDVWDDCDPNFQSKVAENHWRNLEKTHHTLGYKEGITESKSRLLQQGFDNAYNEQIHTSSDLGIVLGKLSTISAIHSTNIALCAKIESLKIRVESITYLDLLSNKEQTKLLIRQTIIDSEMLIAEAGF
jgi:hypothetical protein